jgi:DNA-binding beta-propeller fold protein YncE
MKRNRAFARVLLSLALMIPLSPYVGAPLVAQTATAGTPASTGTASSASAADRALAGDEFRRGVQAYYRRAFNDSILVFEKALSYLPGEPLILDWLGKAYFRSGAEGSALQQWQFAMDAGYGAELLKTRIETVRERRMVRPAFGDDSRYVEASQITSTTVAGEIFRQPVSVAALDDGTFWMSAYGSNELVRFDVNGQVVGRTRGSVAGFDRPFDLVRSRDKRLFVTEVGADRVSILDLDGKYLSSFGEKGRGNGQFVGPQYLAFDSVGNIYVTDYGNARVVVFDPSGAPLFTFGKKDASFPGFKAPGGIAVCDGIVYVADTITGAIHEFDTAGNYSGTLLPEGSIVQSESLRAWDGYLLVPALNAVYAVDPNSGATFDVAKLGNAPVRITSAMPDINGNLLLADYKGNVVQVVSRMSELVGGLFVQIDRVVSDSFPLVTLELRVEDRNRNPVVGLKESNFLVTEEKRPVADAKLVASGWLDTSCDITVVVDRSASSDSHKGEIRQAISEIARAMNGAGTLRLVSAGAIPVQEGAGSPETGHWDALAFKASASRSWAFDLAVRLAANDLVNASRKRAIVFLSTGEVGEAGFKKYGLNDLASYLNNNGIMFSNVYLTRNAGPDEYEYLARSTGGRSYFVFRNEGLAEVVSDARAAANGTYMLTYTSTMPTDFGRAYLPVEVEAYLMNRSGRDETGYFAPLK